MQLVAAEPTSSSILEELVGAPLSVVFAEAEAIERVRRAGEGAIPLEPPFHVSDEDAYLVLPDDIGTEIVDILRDHDHELLHESLRDGLVVLGCVERRGPGVVELHAEEVITPAEALRQGLPYAADVTVGGDEDPVSVANDMDHVQCTMVSGLLDDEGLEQMLRRPEHVGATWRVPPEAADRLVGVEPTYGWSRHLGPGRVGIELALFAEEEELVVLLRPLRLLAG